MLSCNIEVSMMFKYIINSKGNRIGPLCLSTQDLSKHRQDDGLEVMLSVPKKANDAMHLSLLECPHDVPTDSLGEVVLQDSFHVWDLRQIIKKGRERRVFLFDLHLLLAKEVKDSHGKAKYIYKDKFMTSELGVTEHIEGDECKFSVWTGRDPMASGCRIILKAPSLEVKQTWVRRLREVIQETYLGSLHPRSPVRVRPSSSQRSSRDLDETTLLDETTENLDRNSLRSFGSGNTTDSDKAGPEMTWVVGEHVAAGAGELTVSKGQQVEVVEPCAGRPDWWVVRLLGETPQEGAVPANVLKPAPQHQTKTSPSRRPLSQPGEEAIEASSDTGGNNASAASPGKQRRGFSGRRWLGGLRGKPSQGKGEKASTSGVQSPATAEKPAPLKKTLSDKKLKLPYAGDSNGDSSSGHLAGPSEETEDDAADLELPPPMKPIQNPPVLQQPQPSAEAPQAEREHHGAGPAQPRIDAPDDPRPSGSRAPQNGSPDKLKKRDFVLKELLETEEVYVSDLELIVDGYMRHVMECPNDPPRPEGLKDGRHRIIFSNIESIYAWHKDKFLGDLRCCMDRPELLGPLFRRFLERKMFLYEAYCRNKPVSEYIVSDHESYFQEIRNRLGQKLQLADLLIKPIQRIQKYHLLVKKIQSYTEQANCPDDVVASLRDALNCTEIIPKNANNMMDVGRLQGFAGNITAQGKLLLQDTLTITDLIERSREKEMHLFLFEQCVIFSDPVGRKGPYTSPTFNYRAHIQMNKMELEEVPNAGAFIINSVASSQRSRQSYYCRPDTEEKRRKWVDALNEILQSQLNFGVALENPGAYLRELREPPQLRNSESVPPSMGGSLAPELRQRSQRAHTKANTINLPTTGSRNEERKKAGGSAATSPTSPPGPNGLSKRPWGLKLRRGGGSGAGEPSADGVVTELRAPELSEPAADVTVALGATATLSCRAAATRASASWRKTAPETRALRHGGRFAIAIAPDGLATLTIHACRASDAGVYCCLVSNELGGVQSSARLTVGAAGAPGVPAVRAHPGGGLLVQWDEPSAAHLEYCRVGEGEWRRATETPAAVHTLALEELPAGQYSFRLVCARTGASGAASGPAPCGGGGGWQREQFARRYSVEEELGRGRTARVLAARDTGTGQRVALKQVVSGRCADAVREYRILSRTAHNGVVRALALFAEVPVAGAHTLVLEAVGGGPLLEWTAAAPHLYTQRAVATHMRQLLSALDWLHTNNVAHLDVRPENILIEVGGAQPQLKLIDLGSAVETTEGSPGSTGREVLPPAPAQLEFAPPECVLGRPPAPAWDAWAAGVFLYVFLTGLSPFLDESIEETTANIIKCDYCFPPEHWSDIDERAQNIIRGLLDSTPGRRLAPRDALADSWFDEAPTSQLSATQLKTFLDRRRPAGHANALNSLRSPSDT